MTGIRNEKEERGGCRNEKEEGGLKREELGHSRVGGSQVVLNVSLTFPSTT